MKQNWRLVVVLVLLLALLQQASLSLLPAPPAGTAPLLLPLRILEPLATQLMLHG